MPPEFSHRFGPDWPVARSRSHSASALGAGDRAIVGDWDGLAVLADGVAWGGACARWKDAPAAARSRSVGAGCANKGCAATGPASAACACSCDARTAADASCAGRTRAAWPAGSARAAAGTIWKSAAAAAAVKVGECYLAGFWIGERSRPATAHASAAAAGFDLASSIHNDDEVLIAIQRIAAECACATGRFLGHVTTPTAAAIDFAADLKRELPGLGWLGRICGCFEEGTEVATPDGLRRIEDIVVGDYVLAWNEATGEVGPQRVTALIRPEPQATYELALRDSVGASETFVTSADHPWFVAGMGWVHTADLTAGMAIARAGGADMVVASLVGSGGIAQTYNLEVDAWHTFLVGQHRVVVHKCRKFRLLSTTSLTPLSAPRVVRPGAPRIENPALRTARGSTGVPDRLPIENQPQSIWEGIADWLSMWFGG